MITVPNLRDWCDQCGEHSSQWCPRCAACTCNNGCDPGCTYRPAEGTCGRCQQPRVVHPARPEWGRTPDQLCTSCWQRYADARANNDYVDWNDAFANASDDELSAQLTAMPDTA